MNSRRAGYSLFEVMVAFAILTIVLAALIPGQASLMARVTGQDDSFLAQDYAFSHLAQVGVTAPVVEGTNTATYRKWQIIESIMKTTHPDTQIDLFKIVVEVHSETGKSLARIETLRGIE